MNPGAQPTTKMPETILPQNQQNLSGAAESEIKRSPELINAELLKTPPHTPEYQKLLQELQGAITPIPTTPTAAEVLSPASQIETTQPSRTNFEDFLELAHEINPEITPAAQALKNRLQSGGLSPDIALRDLTLEFNPQIQSLKEQIATATPESENREISEKKKTFTKKITTRLAVLPQSPIIESGLKDLFSLYKLNLETNIHSETISNPAIAAGEAVETTKEALTQMDTQIQQTTQEIADIQNDLQETEATNQDLEKQRSAKTKEAELITVQFQSGIEELPSAGKKAA